MTGIVRAAAARVRALRGRALLAAAGIAAAAAMAGAAVYVAYALDTGFQRSAQQADLPDVVARFDEQPEAKMAQLIRSLPNVQAFTLRLEINRVRLRAGTNVAKEGAVQVVPPARRGYAITDGRDVRGDRAEAVIERGLANRWDLRPGDTVSIGRLGPVPVVGVSVAPDNVAFPLASAPRVQLSQAFVEKVFEGAPITTNQALVWTQDPSRTDITLQQARATAFGIDNLRFITRAGVRVLVDQAAGIVIALLVTFSLVALLAAAVLLVSQSAADVQRSLPAIGVRRAIGVPRLTVAAEHAGAAALLGALAGGVGVLAGVLAVASPATGVLEALNEQPPGSAAILPLAATWVGVVAVATLAAGWPAWRAAGRAPVTLLRGGADLAGRSDRRASRRSPAGGGFVVLGMRLALARPGRAVAAVAVLSVCGGVLALMLGLSSLVLALRDDPGSIGKKYQLTAKLGAESTGDVRAIPGVRDAAPRYLVRGVDSFALGEPVKLIAFPGDHTRFEAPALADGRRVRADDEAEVGTGLAEALGVRLGARLAVQLPSGGEARFKVVGTVRAIEDDGRVAYVRPQRVLGADPSVPATMAIRLDDGADRAAVGQALRDLGAEPSTVGAATTRSTAFLGSLATLLRAVGIIDALVCLYALAQALGLTARERRPTLALLRSAGASSGVIQRVLVGAALVLAVPAALLAVVLQRYVFAPLVGGGAAGYTDLQPTASALQSAGVVAAFGGLGLVAAVLVARRVLRETVVAGLGDA